MNTKIIQIISDATYTRVRAYVCGHQRVFVHRHDSKVRSGIRNAHLYLKASVVSGALVGVITGAVLLTGGTAQAIVQGYQTKDSGLVNGMAAALSVDQPVTQPDSMVLGSVEKSSMAQADRTLGVVVSPQSDAAVTVTTNQAQVYVSNSGTALVFATNLNGDIKKGDLLAPSPLRGVLMRASEGTKGVLGVAQEDFPTQNVEMVTVREENVTAEVQVAPVTINMDVKFVTNTAGVGKNLLQRLGETVVGREVSAAQVVIAMIILVMLVVVEGGIVYAAVSSTILALGRNPFARKTILRALFQITILVGVVLMMGLAAIYLVLWL